jgi:hypothetical protein
MALNIRNDRMVQLINETSDFNPTIGVGDHITNSWGPEEIYSGEIVVDEYNKKIYVGVDNEVYSLFKLDNNDNAILTSNNISGSTKSILFGNNNGCNGNNNLVVGYSNSVNDHNNIVAGAGNQAKQYADCNLIVGIGNQVYNDGNLVAGLSNTLSSFYSLVIGQNNQLTAYNSAIIGSNISGSDNNTLYTNNIKTTGNVNITGNLYVSGSTISANVENLDIKDNIILLNSGETGSGVSLINSGIEIDRGLETNAKLYWNDDVDRWQINSGSSLLENIAYDSELQSVSSQTYINLDNISSLSSTTYNNLDLINTNISNISSLSSTTYNNLDLINTNISNISSLSSTTYQVFENSDNTQIIFNSVGTLTGSSNFTYNYSENILNLNGNESYIKNTDSLASISIDAYRTNIIANNLIELSCDGGDGAIFFGGKVLCVNSSRATTNGSDFSFAANGGGWFGKNLHILEDLYVESGATIENSIIFGESNTNTEHNSITGGKGNQNYGKASMVIGGELNSANFINQNSGDSSIICGLSNQNKIAGDGSIIGGASNENNSNYSILGGYQNTNTGNYSNILGQNNQNLKYNSIIGGQNNYNNGHNSILGGKLNTNNADKSLLVGESNTNNNSYNMLAGIGLRTSQPNRTRLGCWNDNQTATLVVGNGTSDVNRKDCLMVGDTALAGSTNLFILLGDAGGGTLTRVSVDGSGFLKLV